MIFEQFDIYILAPILIVAITAAINSWRYIVSVEIMSMFQPSLKNLAKAEERKLDQNQNGNDSEKRAELDKIIKEGLSPNSFKKEK